MDEKTPDSSSAADMQRHEPRVAPQRIVLTGFMGSGKSTCGKLLAKRIDWRFVDVDQVIEAETGMKIAEIFGQLGEAGFREMEAAAITRLLAEEALVLALGGGAIENESARARLDEPGTLLVHLEVSLETALARCRGNELTRPVLADQENLAARYERRLPIYRSARINLNVDTLTPPEVVEKILTLTEF
jgi:shikimate kinase